MTITLLDPKETKLQKLKFDKEDLSVYLNDPFTLKNLVVKDDEDDIIAVGIIKLINEWKVIVNPEKSNLSIARAIRELSIQGLAYCNLHGSNEIYAIITNGGDNYKNMLKRHFGFYEVQNQGLLKLEI